MIPRDSDQDNSLVDEGTEEIINGFFGKPLKAAWPMRHKQLKNHGKNVHPIICYVCQGPEVPGKFDPKKAMELGLKPGPLYKDLIAGKRVQSPSGEWIEPHQCVAVPKPRRIFCIIEIPSEHYVNSVIENEELNDSISKSSLVILMCRQPLLPLLVEWIQSFNCQIILCTDESKAVTFKDAFELIKTMNNVDPTIFPLPIYNGSNREALRNVVYGKPNMTFQFEPYLKLYPSGLIDKQNDVEKKQKSRIDEIPVQDGALSEITDIDPNCVARDECIDDDNIRVIPFGTASSSPGKYRNVSSLIIQTREESFLLDCGEGTLGQLKRRYSDYATLLKTLNVIFISHLHADHHLGLFSIIKERSKVTSLPITVIGPYMLKTWIDEYQSVEELNINFVKSAGNLDYSDKFFEKITTVPVVHCQESYAGIFKLRRGEKICYSGDCRPSTKFAALGKEADLLIHEATFEDELKDEAKKKLHCTVSEAISVSERMNAKHLLLTHFSQRYSKYPPFSKNIAVAQDLMRITLQDFERAAKYHSLVRDSLYPEIGEFHDQEHQVSKIFKKRKSSH